jgi:quercetin dioxygenase-like cupin family protein
MSLSMQEKPTTLRNKRQWPVSIQAEFEREAKNPNGSVGQELISETDRLRIWRIHLKPGERVGFHRHVLDYFWSAATSGKGRQYFNDGFMREYNYRAGETRHETYSPGEYKVHDLENIGDTDLTFVTVEFLQSANEPLPIAQVTRADVQHSQRNKQIQETCEI